MHIMTINGWRPLHVPCTNTNQLEGVYRPEVIDEVRKKMPSRLERFLEANAKSIMEKQQHFRGHHFIEPLYGAFGEKL